MFKDETEKQYLIDRLIEWISPVENPRQTLAGYFVGTTLPAQLGQGD